MWRLLFLVLVLFPAGPASAVQLLANPCFDPPFYRYSGNAGQVTGEIAGSWGDNSNWATVTAHYGEAAALVETCQASQQINVSALAAGSALQLAQAVTLRGGYTYRLQVWLSGTPGTQVAMRLQNEAAPYNSFAATNPNIQLTAQPKLYSVAATMAGDAKGLFIIGVWSTGTVVVDAAALTETPTLPVLPSLPVAATFFGLHIAGYAQGSLANPGFEGAYVPVGNYESAKRSGVVATGWQDNSAWESVDVAYAADRAKPHGGTSDQQVQVISLAPSAANPAPAVQLMQYLTLAPEERYSASVWLRGSSGSNASITLLNNNPPYNGYGQTTIALSPNWTQAKIENALVTDSGQVQMVVSASTPQTFWVDDALVTNAKGASISGHVPWPALTVGTLRLWDSGTTWHDLEPLSGQWNFATLDAWVAAAQAHGSQVVLTLGQTPAWASSQSTASNGFGEGAPAPPASIAQWTGYVRTLAQRYKGRIHYWEIWNEPQDSYYFTGTVQALANLAVAARTVLKSVDPANMVLAPAVSISPGGGTTTDYSYALGYLDRFLAAGGGAGTDVLTVHAYASPPEASAQMLPDVRLVMAKYGLDAPLWETEGSSGDSGVAGASGAAILARKYLVDLIYGAQRFIWYTWGPEVIYPCPPTDDLVCVGTVSETAQLAPDAAGLGLAELESWLLGATVTDARIDGGGTWQIALTLADKTRAAIVWNPAGDAQTTLPGGLVASMMVSLAGVDKPVSGSVVTATPAPSLFR